MLIVSNKQINYVFVVLFLSVALNPEWNSNPLIWWGSFLFAVATLIYSNSFKISIPNRNFLAWSGSFFIVCVLSCIYAINATQSIDILKTLIPLFVFLLILDGVIKTKEDLEKYIMLYLISTFILIIYVYVNVDLKSFQLAQHGFVSMNMWNGNDVGTKCAIFVIISLYFIKNNNSLFKRLVLLAALGLSLYLVFCTASRKAILIVVLGLCLLLYLNHPSKRLRNIFIIVAVLYSGYTLVMTIPEWYNTIGWRLEGAIAIITGRGSADSSALLRAEYIEVGWEAFKENPILGYGINNYRLINLQATGHQTYSHNNFIEILVGIGIVGFFIYYSFYLKLTVDYIKVYLKRLTTPLIYTIAVCFIMMFLMHVAVVSYYSIGQNIIILFFAKALQLRRNITQDVAFDES